MTNVSEAVQDLIKLPCPSQQVLACSEKEMINTEPVTWITGLAYFSRYSTLYFPIAYLFSTDRYAIYFTSSRTNQNADLLERTNQIADLLERTNQSTGFLEKTKAALLDKVARGDLH